MEKTHKTKFKYASSLKSLKYYERNRIKIIFINFYCVKI